MPDFAERVKHYDTKCREHLNRVRLSHVLALGALSSEQVCSNQEYENLIRSSFGNGMQDVFEPKLRMVLHELHLVSLKANFELFLNRLLSTVWTFHFTELALTIPRQDQVSLRELAVSLGQVSPSSADATDFIIDRIVPVHGLRQFVTALESATNIRLSDVLNRKDFHYWPQICSAFEVRHLVEHRDGRVDREFRKKMDRVWDHSSWGRHQTLDGLQKVVVGEEDVTETYSAMLNATGLLTEEVLQWAASKAGGRRTHEKAAPDGAPDSA